MATTLHKHLLFSHNVVREVARLMGINAGTASNTWHRLKRKRA